MSAAWGANPERSAGGNDPKGVGPTVAARALRPVGLRRRDLLLALGLPGVDRLGGAATFNLLPGLPQCSARVDDIPAACRDPA